MISRKNELRVDLCVDCHNELGNTTRDMENEILMNHKGCYERILNFFMDYQGRNLPSLNGHFQLNPDPNYLYRGSVELYQSQIIEGMVCPKCKRNPKHTKLGMLTKHHVFKSAIFGKNGKNDIIIYLCRDCHSDLEILITKMEMLILEKHKSAYTDLFKDFMAPKERDRLSQTKALWPEEVKI